MPFIRTPGGAFVPAAGSGGSLDINSVALVDPISGNDTTGTIGDLTKPYLTMQGAFDDGATLMWLAPKGSAYDGISTPYSIDIDILPLGSQSGDYRCVVSNLVSTAASNSIRVSNFGPPDSLHLANASVSPTLGPAGAVTLYNCSVGSVYANGSAGEAGANGYGGGTVTMFRCIVTGEIRAWGGGGGDRTGGACLTGGSGGAIDLTDCHITANNGTFYAYGGGGGAVNGGVGGGYTGGFGGTGGTIKLLRCYSDPYLVGATYFSTTGGSGNTGSPPDMYLTGIGSGGMGGSGGELKVYSSYLPGGNFNAGGGDAGNNGDTNLIDGTGGHGATVTFDSSYGYAITTNGGACSTGNVSNGGNVSFINSYITTTISAALGASSAGANGTVTQYMSYNTGVTGSNAGSAYFNGTWN